MIGMMIVTIISALIGVGAAVIMIGSRNITGQILEIVAAENKKTERLIKEAIAVNTQLTLNILRSGRVYKDTKK